MAEFKLGDIVQLKSGGPVMTFVAAQDDTDGVPIVRCIWFGEKKKQETGGFTEAAVEIYS